MVRENKSFHYILHMDGQVKGVDGVPADEGGVGVDLLARHTLQLTQQAPVPSQQDSAHLATDFRIAKINHLSKPILYI